MRLAAQVKGGFYPANEDAVAYAVSFLRPTFGHPFAILDPCAGEGKAIRQFRDSLGCDPARTFAIELDDVRAEAIRENLPDARVLAPADFFGCRASCSTFSFIWLNPPFDYSFGGYRVEEQFLSKATEWLISGGVIALVCPEDVVDEYSHVRKHFMSFYENVTITPFPEECRRFNEVIVFGHRRTRPRVDASGCSSGNSWESIQAPQDFRYLIPSGTGPRVFQKVEPTETELERMLATSPLRSHLASTRTSPVPSPPLPLGIGHVALLLASGHLDGVIDKEGELPHVVKGTSRKHSFVSDVTDAENPDGSTTTKTTISERIDLVIRTVNQGGLIQTFSETDARVE